MTPYEIISLDEIGALLEQIAARDQRTTGETDVTAWWNDLNTARITYSDAQAAVNYFHAVVQPAQKEADRYRLTSVKLIEMVRKVRAERLENFVYQPTPGETGAEFIANYHRQRRAVAAGLQPPAPSITQALHPRPVAELVAGVAAARALPPEIAEAIERRRPHGTEVRCPVCGAPPRTRCRAVTGKRIRELSTIHPTRIQLAETGQAQP